MFFLCSSSLAFSFGFSLLLSVPCPVSLPVSGSLLFPLLLSVSSLSLICNEAVQLPEGQCHISPRDQHEGHIDKGSCHQILQLHIKCTVHGKDREGAGRAQDVVWKEVGR